MVEPPCNRVLCFHGSDEVTWNYFCPLVDELVEGVLSIGTRLSPYDGTSGIIDTRPSTRYTLPIALHVTLIKQHQFNITQILYYLTCMYLLEISCKTVQVLQKETKFKNVIMFLHALFSPDHMARGRGSVLHRNCCTRLLVHP